MPAKLLLPPRPGLAWAAMPAGLRRPQQARTHGGRAITQPLLCPHLVPRCRQHGQYGSGTLNLATGAISDTDTSNDPISSLVAVRSAYLGVCSSAPQWGEACGHSASALPTGAGWNAWAGTPAVRFGPRTSPLPAGAPVAAAAGVGRVHPSRRGHCALHAGAGPTVVPPAQARPLGWPRSRPCCAAQPAAPPCLAGLRWAPQRACSRSRSSRCSLAGSANYTAAPCLLQGGPVPRPAHGHRWPGPGLCDFGWLERALPGERPCGAVAGRGAFGWRAAGAAGCSGGEAGSCLLKPCTAGFAPHAASAGAPQPGPGRHNPGPGAGKPRAVHAVLVVRLSGMAASRVLPQVPSLLSQSIQSPDRSARLAVTPLRAAARPALAPQADQPLPPPVQHLVSGPRKGSSEALQGIFCSSSKLHFRFCTRGLRMGQRSGPLTRHPSPALPAATGTWAGARSSWQSPTFTTCAASGWLPALSRGGGRWRKMCGSRARPAAPQPAAHQLAATAYRPPPTPEQCQGLIAVLDVSAGAWAAFTAVLGVIVGAAVLKERCGPPAAWSWRAPSLCATHLCTAWCQRGSLPLAGSGGRHVCCLPSPAPLLPAHPPAPPRPLLGPPAPQLRLLPAASPRLCNQLQARHCRPCHQWQSRRRAQWRRPERCADHEPAAGGGSDRQARGMRHMRVQRLGLMPRRAAALRPICSQVQFCSPPELHTQLPVACRPPSGRLPLALALPTLSSVAIRF